MPIATVPLRGKTINSIPRQVQANGVIPLAAKLNFWGREWERAHNPYKPYACLFCDDGATLRFEVRSGDDQSWLNGGGSPATSLERAEILSIAEKATNGQDYWVSFNFLIEAGETTTTDPIIFQLHNTNDNGESGLSPPFHVRLRNDRLAIMTLADDTGSQITTKPQAYPPEWQPAGYIWTIQRYITPTALPRNVWHRLLLRVVFGWNGGQLQVWLNGAEVYNASIPIGYNDTVGPYPQFGVYRFQAPETLAMRYHAFEFGAASLINRLSGPYSTNGLSSP